MMPQRPLGFANSGRAWTSRPSESVLDRAATEGVGSAGLQLGLRDQRGSKILTQRTYRKPLELQRCPLNLLYRATLRRRRTNSIYFEEASVIFSGLLLTAPDKRQDCGERRLIS